jgi:hypothetical protein
METTALMQVGRFLVWLREWGRTSPENGWLHTPTCVGWLRRLHSTAGQAES